MVVKSADDRTALPEIPTKTTNGSLKKRVNSLPDLQILKSDRSECLTSSGSIPDVFGESNEGSGEASEIP